MHLTTSVLTAPDTYCRLFICGFTWKLKVAVGLLNQGDPKKPGTKQAPALTLLQLRGKEAKDRVKKEGCCAPCKDEHILLYLLYTAVRASAKH